MTLYVQPQGNIRLGLGPDSTNNLVVSKGPVTKELQAPKSPITCGLKN